MLKIHHDYTDLNDIRDLLKAEFKNFKVKIVSPDMYNYKYVEVLGILRDYDVRCHEGELYFDVSETDRSFYTAHKKVDMDFIIKTIRECEKLNSDGVFDKELLNRKDN